MITAEHRKRPKKVYTSQKVKTAVTKIIENHGNISRAMIEAGYSPNTAKKPTNLTDTKAYKHEARNVVQRLEGIRDRIIEELESKDISKEQLFTLGASLKNLTHDIQLLSGNKTENVGIEEERRTLNALLIELRSKP